MQLPHLTDSTVFSMVKTNPRWQAFGPHLTSLACNYVPLMLKNCWGFDFFMQVSTDTDSLSGILCSDATKDLVGWKKTIVLTQNS